MISPGPILAKLFLVPKLALLYALIPLGRTDLRRQNSLPVQPVLDVISADDHATVIELDRPG